MNKYKVVCPSCNSEFENYEKYINHVFEKHENQPSLRMRARIVKKENNEE
jgi:uncharacterized C2H2 Zn-finger protein